MNNDNKENSAVTEAENREQSYGGYQYKRNYDEYKKEQTENKENGKLKKFVPFIIILAFAVVVTVLVVLITDVVKSAENPVDVSHTTDTGTLEHEGALKTDKVKNSVVEVSSASGNGCGLVMTEDGHILTCYTLISNGDVNVKIKDTLAAASVLGFDTEKNIALIKVDAAELLPVKLGYSDSVKSGDSLTLYKKSTDETFNESVVDISADIIKFGGTVTGMGCAVINENGDVVGILSGERTAVTSNALSLFVGKTISDIPFAADIEDKRIDALNIFVKNVTEEKAALYNLPQGCFVSFCRPDSVFKKKDIITEVNGTAVSNDKELTAALKDQSGVKLTVYRSNEYIEIEYN